MPTQAKIDKVTDLKERFEKASNIFVTDYAGLNVEQMTRLRKELRDNGVNYFIAKNTLMRIAAREAGYENLVKYLKGPTAIAFSRTEPNIPAKVLFDAFKEFSEVGKPEVKTFYIDKKVFEASAVERIAKLPGREQLLSQLVTAIESPLTGLVGTLDSILRELVNTVDAVARKKGEV